MTNQSKYVDEIWERCIPATYDHPYIHRKQGIPEGLRIYPADAAPLTILKQNVAGSLVVPCWSNGELKTVQFILPGKGEKLNLPGASFGDGFFIQGKIFPDGVIYLVEGIGHVWAAYKAAGKPVVSSFGSGRLMAVARALRGKYPSARIVILPDRGKEVLAAKIAAAIDGEWVELPQDMPENDDVSDFALEHGHDALEELLAHSKRPEMRFKPLSAAIVCNFSPMKYLVQGIIPAKGLAAIYGPSGSGKSFLALDMAASIASGADWFGLRVTRSPVAYVCLEGGAGIGKRVTAWVEHYGKPFPDAGCFIMQSFDLLLEDDVTDLAKAINLSCGSGALVVIDTLNRAVPGTDENSSQDMGSIISEASRLQELIQGVLVLVHHTGKDVSKGLRGHSSLRAALDAAIEVAKTPNGHEWKVDKSKDDLDGNSYSFRLESVSVGMDEEGQKITSCVVIPDERASEAGNRKKSPLPKGGHQKVVWDVMGDMFKTSKNYGKGRAPIDRACVQLDEVIEKTRGRLTCDLGHHASRVRDAVMGMVGRGLLDLQDGWLWTT